MTGEPTDGWSLVAQHEEAAQLVGTLVDLDTDVVYSRSEIAEAADLPLKTLYLAETLEELAATDMLDRVDDPDDDSEACFRVNKDSDALAAARAFDAAVAEELAVEAE